MTDRLKMVCEECGSDDVRRDAYAEWDEGLQEWVLAQTFDEAVCEQCSGSCSITELPLTTAAPTPPTIHDQAREKTALALTYGEDGAFLSAASQLHEAARMYETRHAEIFGAPVGEG